MARLAKDEGVTVFLTTQYLEEADVLADRVGIIDHGHIVAEGTPAALKAEIGRRPSTRCRSSVEERDASPRVLERFGEPCRSTPGRRRGAALRARRRSPDVVRALDGRTSGREPPAARADARRRLPREDRTLARGRRREPERGCPPPRCGRSATAGRSTLARRSVVRTLRPPASVDTAAHLPARADGRERGGLERATELPGFPTDTFLAFALAVPFIQGALFATMNAGTDLARDIETGFLNRLSLTSMRASR